MQLLFLLLRELFLLLDLPHTLHSQYFAVALVRNIPKAIELLQLLWCQLNDSMPLLPTGVFARHTAVTTITSNGVLLLLL
uniref:Putative secreted protein n=1 Tax=Anopheles darlingi TaxID=43151 RepID=A0A2M4DJ52_ANODA